MYRFDLVFSYWIVAWWLLHLAGFVTASPKLALALALAENVVFALVLALYVKPSSLLAFLAISCLIKVLPLWTVWNETIHWQQDAVNLMCLLVAYCIYLFVVQGIDPVTVYRRMWKALQEGVGDPTWTPGITMLHDMQQKIR